MTYKGIVKENVIILPEDVHLPNGTVVEVLVAPTTRETEIQPSAEELNERRALVARMQAFGEKLKGRNVNLGALVLDL